MVQKAIKKSTSKTLRPNDPTNRGKTNPKGKDKEKEKNIVRGKEVTIRDSAAPAQVVYGRMRIGGVTTMVHTTNNTYAYLQTGEEESNSLLLWTAKASGASGNNITVRFVNPGPNNASTTCSVSETNITITLATNGSSQSISTLNAVKLAVEGNGTAAALVKITKVYQSTNGIVQAMSLTSLQYGGGSVLHQIITLAGHEIDAVEKLYLDGNEVQFGGSPDTRWAVGKYLDRVFMAINLGGDDQEAQPDCVAQLPTIWTTAHRQRGNAHVYLIMVFADSIFPEGLPEIEFLVRGKKCYDPRAATTSWTQNAALIINDFLSNTRFGCGLSNINTQSVIDAANICDQLIPRKSLSDEKRYEFNGVFDPTEGADSILDQMKLGIGGEICDRDGQIHIKPGIWETPTITFNEDDLRGSVRVTTHVSKSDRFNYARGTYVGADYQETDLPPVKSSLYIDEDGQELYQDFTLNFVQSPTQGQRILKIELEKIRQGITVNVQLKLSGLLVNAGDNIYLSLSKYGWSSKPFKVVQTDIIEEDDAVIGVDLELRETSEGIYYWDTGYENTVDIAPNTTLPDPFTVSAPSNILVTSGTSDLYIRGDGTVQSRMKVSWSQPEDQFVQGGGYYEIRHKKTTDSNWIATARELSTSSFCYILDVQDGVTYNVSVRAINVIGATSDWISAVNHTVIGKIAPPSDIDSSFSATKSDYGIIFTWSEIADLDRSEYEIRVGASWEAGELIWRGKGNSFRWDNKVAGTYNFYIKAYDTSGNQSTNARLSTLTINAPSAPVITAAIIEGTVKLSWLAANSDFAIKEYEIRYGSSYATGVLVSVVSALNYTATVNWGGIRTFWIVARDISGNVGIAQSCNVEILNPNFPQGFTVSTNNATILLDWQDPTPSTLPIAEYRVYKGATFEESILLGTVYGTFHTYVESAGGRFTYHVESVDTAGNISSHVSYSTTVAIQTDFFIQSEIEFINNSSPEVISETLLNAQRVTNSFGLDEIYLSINTEVSGTGAIGSSLPLLLLGNGATTSGVETWGAWWDANGWSNWQDAITAGYGDNYLTPVTLDPGYVEWKVDYGFELSQSFIDFSQVQITTISGSSTITYDISVSLDNVTWTDYADSNQVFVTYFRYVKYKINFEATTDKTVVKIVNAPVQLGLNTEQEYQICNVVAADAATGGTLVTFDKEFSFITNIQATCTGLDYSVALVNFVDEPYPTSCKILLYDINGDPVNSTDAGYGPVYVTINGSIDPF